MRGQTILALLADGVEMTADQVSQTMEISVTDARARLSYLVRHEKLTRIPGIASSAARYKLKIRTNPWGPHAA